ncbi:Protein ApaG [Camellia lanceoleosa]|nr:Protein ApaG [Camellia lanceoleosa]
MARMHSLNLRVLSDFNTGTTRSSWPGRFGCGVSDFEAGTRRRWLNLNCRDQSKTWRIVACSSDINSGGDGGGSGGVESQSSFLSRSQTYVLLKQQMEVAAKSEDYKEAARLRDSLRLFEEEEPILHMRRLMNEAIADESQPSERPILFAYRIRITNNSDRPVQLLRRHWIITDANGRTENVWGIGVIGEQPVILPNTGFEYSSACPLSTPSGRMEGDFEMKHIDKVGSKTFNVAIAPFSLSTLGDGTDIFERTVAKFLATKNDCQYSHSKLLVELEVLALRHLGFNFNDFRNNFILKYERRHNSKDGRRETEEEPAAGILHEDEV